LTAGRPDGRTVGKALALMGLLAVWPSDRPAAQVSFHIAVGARYSSTLVHDSIAAPFDVRPSIAPALLVIVRGELKPRLSADATIDVTPSNLERHEAGSVVDIGSFTTIAVTVGLRREISWGLSARAGIGALRYVASETGSGGGGLFREGSGGLLPLGTIAATLTPQFGARRRLGFEARYDLHGFITPAMRTQGFSESRAVHRVALLVRLGWAAGPPPP
jgi:hypothetical protein